MARFIFRFTGAGAKPAADVRRILTHPETSVVAESDRMILVEATAAIAATLHGALKNWSVSAEESVPLPNPRPTMRKPETP